MSNKKSKKDRSKESFYTKRYCLVCKREFHILKSYLKYGKGKFCSRPCSRKINDFKNGHRTNRGKISWNKGLKGYKSGDQHWHWKGGITPKHVKIRNSLRYKKWRKDVFYRDNYTCKVCGKRGNGILHADHIKPFAFFPELRFNLDNGRTLCKICHKNTDTYAIKIYA